MLRDTITLRVDTVLAMIRWREAEPHPVLASVPTWHDDDALRSLDQHARAELAGLGLTDDPDLDDAVGLLVRPDRELYGWIDTTFDGRRREYGVLAVSGYGGALLAVHEFDNGVVALLGARPEELLAAFLAQLPDAPAADGESVTMPYDELEAATAPRGEGFGGFSRRPVNPNVRAALRILARPRWGGGNLYAARKTANGHRVRAESPVTFIDTDDGRWLTMVSGRDGQRWATAAPATPQLIADRLREQESLIVTG
ncbi:ESAT-6 protein secretion system EspG family protein [Herbihabitans rhizosphaerae]|uniref:ESAT-6 protein secretion system EspG family protein n=1 Tax=Herbihabitans rhizosphaerae TaxID=1872711 RepID=A0A4Q7KWD0_9PSEU|nr:ESX secretion-associated protein EspG [Herbihabitans rhizosphaerae]RZS41369.1 ESAT-6 protein secretion system EspG family protein [Herbihabitans rhizosphaerae]